MEKIRVILVVLGLVCPLFGAQEVVTNISDEIDKEEVLCGCFREKWSSSEVRSMINSFGSCCAHYRNEIGLAAGAIFYNYLPLEALVVGGSVGYFGANYLHRCYQAKNQGEVKDRPCDQPEVRPEVHQVNHELQVNDCHKDPKDADFSNSRRLVASLVHEGGLESFGGGGKGLYEQVMGARNNSEGYESLNEVLLGDNGNELLLLGHEERVGYLMFYRNEILLDPVSNTLEFMSSVKRCLNDGRINDIASKTEGFSYDELETIFTTLLAEAAITENGLISAQLVDKVMQQVIDKHTFGPVFDEA
jgi:hypothetical protein